MANIILVLGLALAAFILVYWGFQWKDTEHVILHLLVSFFVLFLLIMIPKAILDSPESCMWNLNESLEFGVNATGSPTDLASAYNVTTLNTYEYQCGTNTHTTSRTFYKIMVWFFGLFLMYVFVYLFYKIFWYMKRGGEFRWSKGNQ